MVCRPVSRADSWVSFCASEIATCFCAGRSVGLNAAVVDAGAIDRLTDPVDVRRLLKLNVDQRAAAKVDPQLDAMPEKDRQHSRYAEDQREGEEIPLFPQPINVNAMK